MSQKGHWGTGDLGLSLSPQTDLDATKPLILMAYEGRASNAPRDTTAASGGITDAI